MKLILLLSAIALVGASKRPDPAPQHSNDTVPSWYIVHVKGSEFTFDMVEGKRAWSGGGVGSCCGWTIQDWFISDTATKMMITGAHYGEHVKGADGGTRKSDSEL
ncbi:hypothetical protein CGMCC3_g4917 [Colletotrichum fructicola]|nr:uncharacterized protein CGMCC3_g4917 [Colletotrichum fructicola]KAE9579238.1 hypothetical protein CGMCC3_g4917 [Colletotrichum fructicola]